jgi:hypothetical protein
MIPEAFDRSGQKEKPHLSFKKTGLLFSEIISVLGTPKFATKPAALSHLICRRPVLLHPEFNHAFLNFFYVQAFIRAVEKE